MKLNNRTVMVTGATSGIGLSLVHALSRMGCQIIAVGRSEDKLSRLEQEYEDIIPFRCDIACRDDLIAMMKQIEEMKLPVSVLINNAAVQLTPRFTDQNFDFEGIEREIDTNLTSIAWLTSLFLSSLIQRSEGAAIVNISSGLAIYPKTSSAVYSATKAAVHSLSQSLRYQFEGTGIRVFEILLPLVDTAMTEGRGTGKISPDHAAKEIINAITSGKPEHYVGKAGLLPFLSRLSPGFTRNILKNS